MAPAIRLYGVNYDDDSRIRDDERNNGLRLTYVDGVLEIVSPEYLHEAGAERLAPLVRVVADVVGIDDTGAGSTTFRRGTASQLKGKEPDCCFYFAHEPEIRRKTTLDLEHDPPPDLRIEVDNRSGSKGRLPIYAEFRVPEVWHYRARTHRL